MCCSCWWKLCTCPCTMATSCCKSLCAFCSVRRHLKQPWNCCSIAAIVLLILSSISIISGLTLMIFYVDYHDSDRLGYRILAWLGISLFCAGILLFSLGCLFWGCVWRIYQTREKNRIHLEMKQGTLFLQSSATSRLHTIKDSPMLTLRNMQNPKLRKQSLRDNLENMPIPGDVTLTRLASPRPTSVVQVVQSSSSSSPAPTSNNMANNNNKLDCLSSSSVTSTRKQQQSDGRAVINRQETTIVTKERTYSASAERQPLDPGQIV